MAPVLAHESSCKAQQPALHERLLRASHQASSPARRRYLRPGKGSHEIWRSKGGQRTTVPHSLKSRHTANNILSEAGIRERV